MKSKIITLKSGRRIKRYEDICYKCSKFKGWKDRNALGRKCQTCANAEINALKKNKVMRSDKYKLIANIDNTDFIKVGNVTKYRTTCKNCNKDRGYKRPSVASKLCNTCSNTSITKKDCIHIASKYNFTFLDDSYISYRYKHKWNCNECNAVFIRSLDDMSKRTNCPHCNRFSNENECRRIFESLFNNRFITVRPDFLKNPKTGRNLELDGYCEELKLAFEYDGEFHYKEMKWIDDRNKLELRQQQDKLKDVLCKQSDIILIRIPYWENKNLDSYINQQLREAGVYNA